MISTPYKKRPVRFLEIHEYEGWKVKIYSISAWREKVLPVHVLSAKKHLSQWLEKSREHANDNYKIATLIVHEGKEGCYAIINWWVGENMLQHYTYSSDYNNPQDFRIGTSNIIICVWELAVTWFERNAWLEYVLENDGNPDFEKYLQQQLNTDI